MHIEELIRGITAGDQKSLARAISLVENDTPRALGLLSNLSINREIPIIGITGPPGAGKSTVANAVVRLLRKENKKIAIVAIDPSSPFNYGALLGDRIRMQELFGDENIFIRSLATRGSLGGMSAKTIEISDILRAAPFDYIFIETVGVGQSEVEIAGLADTTIVIFVPEAGDEIQTMKAGIMEIANIFVVNKSDRPDADRFAKNLKMLAHSHVRNDWEAPVINMVATNNEGAEELLGKIHAHASINNTDKQTMLLANKAFSIIQSHRMSDIHLGILQKELEESLATEENFNLYRSIAKYLN